MSLSNLIRRKSEPVGFATATPATFATDGTDRAGSVAEVATVAVAKSPAGQATIRKTGCHEVLESYPRAGTVKPFANVQQHESLPLTAIEEAKIWGWLAFIEETDPNVLDEVMRKCREEPSTRRYVLKQAEILEPKPIRDTDDRITCKQCSNLIADQCQAARRGELPGGRSYVPLADLPRRCPSYSPRGDTDGWREPPSQSEFVAHLPDSAMVKVRC